VRHALLLRVVSGTCDWWQVAAAATAPPTPDWVPVVRRVMWAPDVGCAGLCGLWDVAVAVAVAGPRTQDGQASCELHVPAF
jgi:hypothetical protein